MQARRISRGRHRRPARVLSVILLASAVGGLYLWYRPASPKSYPVKCAIVGLDGLDPKLCKKWMDAGLLPNLSRLAKEGTFSTLATSNPPQSPVAWSSFVTGMNPGGTGVFDFVHRDPLTYTPLEAMSHVKPPDKLSIPLLGDCEPEVTIGGYRFQYRDDKRVNGRKGTPFWKYLEDAGVPAVVLRVPCNYPPTPGKTVQITGMSTPDLTGSNGAFFYWTSRALSDKERESLRGRSTVEEVRIDKDGQVRVDRPDAAAGTPNTPRLEGPINVLKAKRNSNRELEGPSTYDYFAITIDKVNKTARIQLDGADAVLRPGDWTDWMTAKFVMADWFPSNPSGMLRFRLKAIEPYFEMYATPINIDPSNPAMPVTNPDGYAKELAAKVGKFTTLGMSEDDKAMGSPVRALDPAGFRKQCRDVLDDAWKTSRYELDRYKGGFFFTYFRTTDVMSHMMWWAMDPQHPARQLNLDLVAQNNIAIEEAYRWVDEKVCEIRAKIGDDALFIVMSDHGFGPFYRQFELNSWLADNGWLTLVPWASRDTAHIPDDVDWTNTKAYALGLNALYINLKGRERDGAVDPKDRDKVVHDLCADLEKITHPLNGEHVISKAYRREDVYSGKYLSDAPDILVGYNYGYRTAWTSALGQFPAPISVPDGKGGTILTYLTDNTGRWSGDHCCDPVHVPGVIFSNRKLTAASPALTDLAPTILKQFGIAEPADMVGKPLMGINK